MESWWRGVVYFLCLRWRLLDVEVEAEAEADKIRAVAGSKLQGDSVRGQSSSTRVENFSARRTD